MTDLHVHTQFSPDSETRAESYLDIAMLCGEERIGFSEHCDFDYVRRGFEVEVTDLEAMHHELLALRERYRGKIEILEGIEYGYAPEAEADYIDLNKRYPFDYVINSVHVPEGETDCFFLPYFGGKDKREAYEAYFRTVSHSLDAAFDFQIVGHLGYVARNAPYSEPRVFYTDFADLLDEIFRKIIARGVALEVNTNVKTAGTPFVPYVDLLRRYRELGGRLVTLGSDAHQARRLFENFDLIRDALLSVGFDRVCWFRRRQCFYESL